MDRCKGVLAGGAALLTAALVVTAWISLRDGRPAPVVPGRPEPAVVRKSAPAPAPTAPDVAAFDLLPPAHQAGALTAAMADLPAWLGARYPEAEPEFLGAACEAPPCIMGLRYEDDGFRDPAAMREFLAAYRAEIERRAGWPMTSVSMDEDRAGVQYVWMYGLPADWPRDEPLRDDLTRGALLRQAARMAPIAPPVAEPVPHEGDVGFGE